MLPVMDAWMRRGNRPCAIFGILWVQKQRCSIRYFFGELSLPVFFFGNAGANWNFFFFSMGAPLLLFYWLFTFKSRVLPNWIAPSVVPLFCLMVVFWRRFWEKAMVRRLFGIGLTVGIPFVILLHDTNLVSKL